MKFRDWLKGQTGLIPDKDLEKQLSDYYYDMKTGGNTTAGIVTTDTTAGNNLTQQQLEDMYKASTVTNSTVSSGFAGSWDNWTKEEKKALAKVGFRYDNEKNEWVLDLTATIRIPQKEGFQAMSSGEDGKPTDQMITNLKQVKEQLIEKLTAKIILAELVRPRDIPDE